MVSRNLNAYSDTQEEINKSESVAVSQHMHVINCVYVQFVNESAGFITNILTIFSTAVKKTVLSTDTLSTWKDQVGSPPCCPLLSLCPPGGNTQACNDYLTTRGEPGWKGVGGGELLLFSQLS